MLTQITSSVSSFLDWNTTQANCQSRSLGFRVTNAALLAVGCLLLSQAQGAAGGKEAYTACIRGCDGMPPGPFKIGCYAACTAALLIPE